MAAPTLLDHIAFLGSLLLQSGSLERALEVEVCADRLQHEAFITILRGLEDGNEQLAALHRLLRELQPHEAVIRRLLAGEVPAFPSSQPSAWRSLLARRAPAGLMQAPLAAPAGAPSPAAGGGARA